MSRTFFLVRHGESEWNAEKRLQGQSDPRLSDAGRDQARLLAPVVETLKVSHVLTSDLSRSVETAKLCGYADLPHDPVWRERGLGEWETHLEADVGKADLAALSAGDLVPPGGESWAAFQARVAGAADALAEEHDGNVLVFTHGGCVRALTAHLTGGDARHVAGPANASLSVFQMAPRRRVMRFNWTPTYGTSKPSDPGA